MSFVCGDVELGGLPLKGEDTTTALATRAYEDFIRLVYIFFEAAVTSRDALIILSRRSWCSSSSARKVSNMGMNGDEAAADVSFSLPDISPWERLGAMEVLVMMKRCRREVKVRYEIVWASFCACRA